MSLEEEYGLISGERWRGLKTIIGESMTDPGVSIGEMFNSARYAVIIGGPGVGKSALTRFLGTGVDMIDGKPRPGLAGKVAFVHPRACGKLLVELATPSSRAPLPETALALAAIHAKVENVGETAQRLQDLFGMSRGFAAEDGSFVQLRLGELTIQLGPLGNGYVKPSFTALRVRAADLPGLARRLGERGIQAQESAVGLVVPPGPGQGAPLIVQAGG